MRAPSPPETPDPYETASAQQMANVEVAVANTFLTNADEDHPNGTVRYIPSGKTKTTFTYDAEGNVTNTRIIEGVKRVVALTPTAQTIYDDQQLISVAMNEWALAQTGLLRDQQATPVTTVGLTERSSVPSAPALIKTSVTADDLTEEIGSANLVAHVNATRDAINARIQYQIEVDRQRRVIALANQGLEPGSRAYDDDIFAFDKQSTDARLQALLAAEQEQTRIIQTEALVGNFRNTTVERKFRLEVMEGDVTNARLLQEFQAITEAASFINTLRAQELQETLATRSHNVNEISALLRGGQVQVPQFQQFRAGAIAQTPVAESVYQSAAMDMQKWQVEVQQQQAMLGGILGFAGNILGAGLAMSDARLKHNVHHLGIWRGLPLISWTYAWGERSAGVMAQDVARLFPHAVVRIGGYLAVDYGRL